MNTQAMYFGAGCFWHVQFEFDQLEGVTATEVGYAGGEKIPVSYEEVCKGNTGHVEVCRVEFDSSKTSAEKICEAFFALHDPTQLNRQGPDVGHQYRSVIYYTNEEQKNAAQNVLQKIDQSGVHTSPIVTTVEPLTTYSPAEEYHQKYFEKTGKRACAL